MKYLKPYSEPRNESVKDFLKPRSDEEIKKLLLDAPPNRKLRIGVDKDLEWLVKLAIEEGANVNKNSDYYLRVSTHHKNVEITNMLLDAGADPEVTGGYVLGQWCSHGNIEMVKRILNMRKLGSFGEYPYRMAKNSGNIEILELLKEYKRKVKKNKIKKDSTNESVKDFLKPKSEEEIKKSLQTDKYSPHNRLVIGCQYGMLWLVKQALKDGADPQLKMIHKHFTLDAGQIAAAYGHIDIVKYLIYNNLYKPDYDIILIASRCGRIDIVKFLLQDGKMVKNLTPGYLRYFTRVANGEIDPKLI